ncbi:MAG: phosphoribosylanthranilate isomerase [Pseudanabaenaceae cyanobacterium]
MYTADRAVAGNVPGLKIKICGLTRAADAQLAAELGATALGFVCVPASPRYLPPAQIRAIAVTVPGVLRIGVFRNAPLAEVLAIAEAAHLSGVQLHGDESPEFCAALGQRAPHLHRIKAFRPRTVAELAAIAPYQGVVPEILVDAYDPHQGGGTGQSVSAEVLATLGTAPPFRLWWLAGGLRPDNVAAAIAQARPDGVDVASGVEAAPGRKDPAKLRAFLAEVKG